MWVWGVMDQIAMGGAGCAREGPYPTQNPTNGRTWRKGQLKVRVCGMSMNWSWNSGRRLVLEYACSLFRKVRPRTFCEASWRRGHGGSLRQSLARSFLWAVLSSLKGPRVQDQRNEP